jgi:hypothetical protein
MNPKKANLIYKEVAEELNQPVELIEDLLQEYYKKIRKNLTNLSYPRINVEGLGQFVARPGLVKKSIQRYKKMLEEKVECLENLDKKLDAANLKKENFKKEKNEKYSETDMGE